MKIRRRRVLELTGISGLLSLAGCGGSTDTDADRSTRTDTTSGDGTPSQPQSATRTRTRTPTRTVDPDLAYSFGSKLLPNDGAGSDKFGSSVAVADDGSTALVAAVEDTLSRGNDDGFFAGSAYVFSREGGTWTQRSKLAPDDIDINDSFGSSVALSGDGTTALVGAEDDEDPTGRAPGRRTCSPGATGPGRGRPNSPPRTGTRGTASVGR